MGTHPNADQRDLRDRLGYGDRFGDDTFRHVLNKRQGFLNVRPWNREGNIRHARLTHVLDDHVDIDVGLGHRPEEFGCNTWFIRHAHNRDFGLIPIAGDSRHRNRFHILIFTRHECPLSFFEAGVHLHRHVELRGKFDGAALQHFGTQTGHFQHFLIGNLVDSSSHRHNVRVGGVDAIDVGKDDAPISLQRRRQRNRCQIRAATPQRRDIRLLVDPLKAGNHWNDPFAQGLADSIGTHPGDTRFRMGIVGHDPNLASRKRLSIEPPSPQGHCQQGDGHPLSGRQQHIEFAIVRQRRDFVRQLMQPIRFSAHRGQDNHDAMAILVSLLNAVGNAVDPLDRAYGRPPIFLDNQRHVLQDPFAKSRMTNFVASREGTVEARASASINLRPVPAAGAVALSR